MSQTDKDRRIAFSIITHLQSQLDSNTLSAESAEGVAVALQCLSEAYGIEVGDEQQRERYGVKPTLEELFAGLHLVTDEDKQRADALKQQGNAHLKQNKFDEAITCYTSAIDVDSTNATYYCNRAAAYIKLQDFQKALVDCKKAVELDPQYARAHGRLGYIYSALNLLQESKTCFKQAIKLDPSNESYKGNLDAVEEKLRSSSSGPQGGGAAPQGGAAGVGAPGGGEGQGLPGLGGMLGAGGLSNLLQNPGFMNMATSMMQSPGFQNMASRMMQQGGTSPAGMMPDMVRTAQEMQQNNPEMFENLRQQAAQFAPPQQGEASQDTPKDSSEQKEQ